MTPGDLVRYDSPGLKGVGVVERVSARFVWVFVGTRSSGERVIKRFPHLQVEPRREAAE